ncbi:MAG TPA: hypothetical protein VHY08_10880 [Bacillota bacterium]|nr:hypothetical protein [Bacillota bacterium]
MAEKYGLHISLNLLSFDLVNEPPVPVAGVMTRADYERVVRRAVAAIREISPERLIMAERVSIGNEPCFELADLKIAQSCRAYIPMGLSHYQASWAPTKTTAAINSTENCWSY